MIPGGRIPTATRVAELREPLLSQLQALHRQECDAARGYLEAVAERLQAPSLTVQTRVVEHENPAAAILEEAQQNAADLIAMATQGRGGLKRLFLGSVADKVVRGAGTPLLVYRPVDKSEHIEK